MLVFAIKTYFRSNYCQELEKRRKDFSVKDEMDFLKAKNGFMKMVLLDSSTDAKLESAT